MIYDPHEPIEMPLAFGLDQKIFVDAVIDAMMDRKQILAVQKAQHVKKQLEVADGIGLQENVQQTIVYNIKFANAYCIYIFGHQQANALNFLK